MGVADIVVLVVAAVLLAGFGWFFFAPRRGSVARLDGGVQRAGASVHGAYSPDVIRVVAGLPASW